MESGMKAGRKKGAKKPAKTSKAKVARPKRGAASQGAAKRAASVKTPLSNGGPITWNFKLIGQHLLAGFGGLGEGISVQIAPDGCRILWLAPESAPKDSTAVRVTAPRQPTVRE